MRRRKAVLEERVQINLQYWLPDYTEIINRSVKEMWQKSWEKERKGRTYYSVQRTVEEVKCAFRGKRRETGSDW